MQRLWTAIMSPAHKQEVACCAQECKSSATAAFQRSEFAQGRPSCETSRRFSGAVGEVRPARSSWRLRQRGDLRHNSSISSFVTCRRRLQLTSGLMGVLASSRGWWAVQRPSQRKCSALRPARRSRAPSWRMAAEEGSGKPPGSGPPPPPAVGGPAEEPPPGPEQEEDLQIPREVGSRLACA